MSTIERWVKHITRYLSRGFCVFMLFSDAIKEYDEALSISVGDNALNGSRIDLRQVALFFGNPHIEQIDERHVVNLFRMMLLLGWKKNTIRPKASEMRNFFKYWRRRHVQVLDPELIPMPKREPYKPRVAKPEQVHLLTKHIREQSITPLTRPNSGRGMGIRWRHLRNLGALLLIRDSGCRVGEAMSLNDDINVETPVDTFKAGGQTGKVWGTTVQIEKASHGDPYPYRQIFWFEEANNALKEWLKVKPKIVELYKNDFVDPNALFFGSGRWQHGKKLSSSAFDNIVRGYCRDIGIPTINPHSLRHLFSHDTVKAKGATAADLMNFQGYASLSSATPYVRMFGNEARDRFTLLHGSRFLPNGTMYPKNDKNE